MEVAGSRTITGKPWLLFLFLFFFCFPRNHLFQLNIEFHSSFLLLSLPFPQQLPLFMNCAAVGGHREAAPHTLHSSALVPVFVKSSRGGFFPLFWWLNRNSELIKPRSSTSETPHGCWGGRWQSDSVFSQTISQAVGTLSNSSALNCSPKLLSLNKFWNESMTALSKGAWSRAFPEKRASKELKEARGRQ